LYAFDDEITPNNKIKNQLQTILFLKGFFVRFSLCSKFKLLFILHKNIDCK